VSSHHDLSLAAFISNIAESDFRYTEGKGEYLELDPEELEAIAMKASASSISANLSRERDRRALPQQSA
jgi:hypothetical protein